jgi:hypothetical protein
MRELCEERNRSKSRILVYVVLSGLVSNFHQPHSVTQTPIMVPETAKI